MPFTVAIIVILCAFTFPYTLQSYLFLAAKRPQVRGCLHDTGATFIPVRVHSGSHLWLCIRLHDTSTKSHTRASHTGASSPRFLYRSEIFTPVRKLVPMSCKRSTTVRSGMKSLSRESGTGSACVCLFNHTSADVKCLFLQPWNEISSLHVNKV